MKTFSVEVEPVEQLKKLGAKGTCYLHITDCELRLVSAADGHLLVAWPFKCLRRYMSSKGKFTIEAGRRAPTGEGVFTFYSAAHDDMYKLLDSVVKSKASKTQSVSSFHDEHKQPVMATSPVARSMSPPSSDDRYVHLASRGTPLPSHPPHPNYNHGMSLTKGTASREPRYASPYGHFQGVTSSMGSTLGQASPVISPNEVLKARGSGADQNYDTLSDQHQVGHDEEDTYNVLNSGSSLPSSSVGGTETVQTEDMYSVLDHDTLKGGTVPPQEGVWDPSDYVYNTLGHQQNSPIKTNAVSAPYKSTYDETAYDSLSPVHSPSLSGETYNTLVHKPRLVKSWEGSSQETEHISSDYRQSVHPADRSKMGLISGSVDDSTYNTLSHNTLPSSQAHHTKSNDATSTYNTLDHKKSHSPLRKHVSLSGDDSYDMLGHVMSAGPPVPERCRLETESSDISRVGSVGSTSSIQCPLSLPGTNLSRSSFSSNQSTPVSPSELDFYASLDYASISPPAGKSPSVPNHRMSQKFSSPTKPRPPPPRKASAPDILADTPNPEPRSPSKSNLKGGILVSNLRASLEAGGLDLMKPKPKPRNLAVQLSQEQSIPGVDADYAVVNDQEVGGLSKTVRSPSVPIEPCNDIYDEPDRPAAPRPKSVPSGRGKKSNNKRF